MPVTLSALSLALERGCLEAAVAGHEADEAGHLARYRYCVREGVDVVCVGT
jgi:hypothetical protein